MRKHTLDNKQVIAPKASLLGAGTRIVKRNSFFTFCPWKDSGITLLARSLGRIATVEPDGLEDCVGYVAALVFSEHGQSCYLRWVAPDSIMEVFDAPTKIAAFFFAAELPGTPEEILRLYEYGSLSERYIDGAQDKLNSWREQAKEKAGA